MKRKYVAALVAVIVGTIAASFIVWRRPHFGANNIPPPIVGNWVLGAEKPCNGAWTEENRIYELQLDPDGKFALFFQRRLHRPDAEGHYEYNVNTNRLVLTLDRANNTAIRENFDGEGTAMITLGGPLSSGAWRGDELILEEIELGRGRLGKVCSMSFSRPPRTETME